MPDRIRAAGALLWRPGPEGLLEVAVIHRSRYDDWSFPKGKLDAGEHPLSAAVREVFEETSIRPVLGRRLTTQGYSTPMGPKLVDYWVATGPDAEFVSNDEVDGIEWTSVAEAGNRLSYERDHKLLAEFISGPPRTTPYMILRHTSAGNKHEWRGDDLLRPLDDQGRSDAALLADLLSCFGPARVVSSATARCVETVLPLVSRTGVRLCTETAFTVGGSAHAGDRLAELIAEDLPTVVCTHGELVPELVKRACAELGAEPPADAALRKGGFLVLQVAAGTLASVERYPSLA